MRVLFYVNVMDVIDSSCFILFLSKKKYVWIANSQSAKQGEA